MRARASAMTRRARLLYNPMRILPPDRSNETSTRHPAVGSARWWSTPTDSMLSNVRSIVANSRISACAYSILRKTGQADVDPEQTGVRIDLRDLNRVQAGTATRDQNIQFGLPFRCRDGPSPRLIGSECGERVDGPARIGIFLVLAHHLQ